MKETKRFGWMVWFTKGDFLGHIFDSWELAQEYRESLGVPMPLTCVRKVVIEVVDEVEEGCP